MSTPQVVPEITGEGDVAMAESMDVVAVLRRFPVKSMQGERLESTTIGERGVLGDRVLAVVDRASGQVVGGKTPDLGRRLLACRASFTAAPRVGHALPPVAIELPDGSRIRSDSDGVDRLLTAYFGQAVSLVSAAPTQSALVAKRGEFLEGAGLSPVELGSLLDLLPVSVVTTSTLDRLGAARPATRFDERRFRMNVVVASRAAGFVENTWPGRGLQLGEGVRLRVAIPVPRCALTTMAQEELPRDPAVLRTVARENSVEIAGRPYPCVGVYATVEAVGEIRTGDVVSLV